MPNSLLKTADSVLLSKLLLASRSPARIALARLNVAAGLIVAWMDILCYLQSRMRSFSSA